MALIAVRQFSNLACNLDNGPAVFVIGSAGMHPRQAPSATLSRETNMTDEHHADRRSFLRTGAIAGTALVAGADDEEPPPQRRRAARDSP
jgi:hypothetical protein